MKYNCGNITLKAEQTLKVDQIELLGQITSQTGEQSSLIPAEKGLVPLTETKRPQGKKD